MRRFMEQRKRRDPVQARSELMIKNGPQHEQPDQRQQVHPRVFEDCALPRRRTRDVIGRFGAGHRACAPENPEQQADEV